MSNEHLIKRQRHEFRKEEQRIQQHAAKQKKKVKIVVYVIIIIVVLGIIDLVWLRFKASIEPLSDAVNNTTPLDTARSACIQHSDRLSMHIHPLLTIYIDNEQVAIPENIGVSLTCMKALHTHDKTGKIHIEYPTKHEFTLGDFFANWGQAFTRGQFLDKIVDDNHIITITVDGQESTENENLILKDEQIIIIRYEQKNSE